MPREEWALAQGKKVLSDGVAAQTIEAQPVFGQIKPSRGEVRRALNNNLREDVADLGSAIQEVKTFRRRERNNVRQTAVSSAENELAGTALPWRLCGPCHDWHYLVQAIRAGPRLPLLKLLMTLSTPIHANLFDRQGKKAYPSRVAAVRTG